MAEVISRKRPIYICLFVVTIGAGLLSRSSVVQLPQFIAAYAGDTLWALMVFWLCCILRPNYHVYKLCAMAIVFAFSIELSQLYHAPWIDYVRSFRLGGLVLGYGFKYSDLICYSVGVLTGGIIDSVLRKRY